MAEQVVDDAPSAGDYAEPFFAVDGADDARDNFVERHYPEETFAFGHAGVHKARTYLGDGDRGAFGFALE